MRTRRRERELRALLRVPEEGRYNVANYIRVHEAELGLDAQGMNGPDEVLAPLLLTHLERRRLQERSVHESAVHSMLCLLHREARWHDGQVVLPPGPFFRLVTATTRRKYIRFVGDGIDVTVTRQLVQRAGAALRVFRDVSVNVDDGGVHLRWEMRRGGLNLFPQALRRPEDALVIALPRRPVVKRMPMLIGEILAELGFGT